MIGLFRGHISGNMLTLNPGSNRDARPLADFDDVRDVARSLAARGIAVEQSPDPDGTGPAKCTVTNPDGDRFPIDQHVPRPERD